MTGNTEISEALRAALFRIQRAENDLVEARSALAAAEAAVAFVQAPPTPPEAYTTEEVAELLG